MDMLSPAEVAQILKVSYHKALEFIKHSGIDYIKIGSQYRVSKDKLFAFINSKGRKII